MDARQIIERLEALLERLRTPCRCEICEEVRATCEAARRMLSELEAHNAILIKANQALRGDLERQRQRADMFMASYNRLEDEGRARRVDDGKRIEALAAEVEAQHRMAMTRRDRAEALERERDELWRKRFNELECLLAEERGNFRRAEAEVDTLEAELSAALDREKVRDLSAGRLKKPEVRINGLMIDLTLAGEHIVITG